MHTEYRRGSPTIGAESPGICTRTCRELGSRTNTECLAQRNLATREAWFSSFSVPGVIRRGDETKSLSLLDGNFRLIQ